MEITFFIFTIIFILICSWPIYFYIIVVLTSHTADTWVSSSSKDKLIILKLKQLTKSYFSKLNYHHHHHHHLLDNMLM